MNEKGRFISGEKIFSFVCPPGREGDALVALDGIDGITLAPDPVETTRAIPDEQNVYRFVTEEITGHCADQGCEDVVKILAEQRIAAYSRVTQVVFRDPNIPIETVWTGGVIG